MILEGTLCSPRTWYWSLCLGGMEWDLTGLSSLVTASDWQIEDGLQSSLFWSTEASRDSRPVQGHITSKGQSWYLPAKSAPSPARNDKGEKRHYVITELRNEGRVLYLGQERV